LKTVLYTCPYVPAEWIAAHGFRPCRALLPQPPAKPCAETLMGACAFAQAFVEQARAWADGPIIFTTVCDQMRRAADQLCLAGDRPVFLLNVPATWQTAPARGLYRAELERLGAYLVRQGGQAPSAAGLAAAMLRYDQARQALLAARAGLSGREFAEAVARLYQDGPRDSACAAPLTPALSPREREKRLPCADVGQPFQAAGSGGFPAASSQKSRETGKSPELADRNVCPTSRRPVPLALVGGPLMPRHFELFDWVEAFGGRVVLDGTLTGERGLPPPFDRERLARDPLAALVEAYFEGIPDVFRRPNSALFAWLRQRLAERGARGIILWHYAWCDLWQAEVSRLKEELGLPLLHLDAGDAAELNPQMLKRVEAFLEVLTA
jgi:hypothetical protein